MANVDPMIGHAWLNATPILPDSSYAREDGKRNCIAKIMTQNRPMTV
jgi:hypothetical protein